MKVSNILNTKGNAVVAVTPVETVQTVAMRFRQEGVGAMIVSGDGTTLDGLITERDVSNGIAVHGRDAHALPASALMTTAVVTCRPEDSLVEVARIMTVRRLRHLPVKQDGRLVGVISIGDVLKHRLDELQLETQVLRDIAVAGR